jgi:hypothetical protein
MLDGNEAMKSARAKGGDDSDRIPVMPAVLDQADVRNSTHEHSLQDYSMSSPSMRVELASLRHSHRRSDPPSHFSSHPKDAILVDPTSLKPDEASPLDLKTASSDSVYPGAEITKLSQPEESCSFRINNHISPADAPKALELVKDKNSALYDAIKNKVNDPTYIGETGDITVPAYDKSGKQVGCIVIKDTPYWLSGNAARSYLTAKDELSKQKIDLTLDPLNGAGRTLEQEKGINIRNPGRHAAVGTSLHGFGNAGDLKEMPDGQTQLSDIPEVRKQLHQNGFRQGDGSGPIGDDLHHWSYAGPGPVTEGHHPAHHKQHHQQHGRRHHN